MFRIVLGPSFPHAISRVAHARKSPLFGHIINLLVPTGLLVLLAEYWRRSFSCRLKVPYFYVGPSTSSAFCYGAPSWFHMWRGVGPSKPRWRAVTKSALSRRFYGKIGDCEESIFLVFYWPPTDFVSVYKNANKNKTNIQSP